jgi:ABC-type microcin C transport system permease subunit YejB
MKSKVEFSYSNFNGAQERERLLQRMKLAKLNAKYGFRKPGNLDYSKILQQYYMIGNPNHEETKSSSLLN